MNIRFVYCGEHPLDANKVDAEALLVDARAGRVPLGWVTDRNRMKVAAGPMRRRHGGRGGVRR